MDASTAHLHPKEKRQDATARHDHVVGYAGARSNPPHFGGILRAAVQRPLPWVSARTWMPYRVKRYKIYMDRHQMVYRRRYQGVFRYHRTSNVVEYTPREYPR